MNCAVHNQTQAVAYCRTCGKALCEDCKRDVMGAIYCEPCIAARLQGAPVAGVAAAPVPPVTALRGSPSPGVAAFLGFIPGVGAMYNGQFVKAFVHVLIFVMLIMATDNISDAFGLLIAFFIFYMVFEAYKTAQARLLGIPAPDPLGLDKMFGIQESQPNTTATTVNVAPASSAVPGESSVPQPAPHENIPVGAVVLVALGALFLLGNLGLMRFNMRIIWPFFLIGFGVWIAYKRSVPRA